CDRCLRALTPCPTRRSSDLEGDRQTVEVVDVVGVHQQAFKGQPEVLPLQQAEREAQLAILERQALLDQEIPVVLLAPERHVLTLDRKSTRLNSSHVKISYAV